MCRPPELMSSSNPSCEEKIGDAVDGTISAFFRRLGAFVGGRPRVTILLAILLTVACGGGFTSWTTENRGDELWVPQDTQADAEEATYLQHFESGVRFNQVIFQSNTSGGNVLTKDQLVAAMKLHNEIEVGQATIEGEGTFGFVDLCIFAFGSCATAIPSSERTVCGCVINSILGQWNYDLATLEADEDWLTTLQGYGSQDDLNGVLGNPVYGDDGLLVSAEAFTVNYLLEDRAFVENGADVDPINGGWEEAVFLNVTGSASEDYPELRIDYFAGRSFEDVFGGAITGDLVLVQISYVLVFLFLGAAMGRIRCGTGSRWTMALAGVLLVGLSLAASFGVSSLAGLFYGPVHSLLPFVLLGIGVDDAFVIVNAFDRERKQPRSKESNSDIAKRCTLALARAGASITVTSATDLVAFAISSSSALPALASFCAYAAIGIFFLWLFASTFFTATLVLDERRQRDNRRECLCCLTRQREVEEDADGFKEGFISKIFRQYHAPTILSTPGKLLVFLFFGGLLAFGVLGALNLAVEDSGRSFIPADSYVQDWLDAGDQYFASRGKEVSFLFEGGSEIYAARNELAALSERVTGLSEDAPYLAEPSSEEIFRNVMSGFKTYVEGQSLTSYAGVALGDDGWPSSEEDFVVAMTAFASFTGPGALYAQDVAINGTSLDAIRVKAEYIRLVKDQRGRQIEDATKLIQAMDETRALAESWDDLPPVTVYGGEDFLTIEGFKIIQRELFQNVGLAILAVAVIVFFTIGSFVTSLLITINVAFAIIEILGFMYSAGVVIDSVAVINMVLAVGLTVDYSAHVGHCFMAKGGTDRNQRATEALADIGSAVLSGATSTFLAVVVLLFSKSYVFKVLAIMFALTVVLGTLHGLVLLPVMLSVFGPKPFSSAEAPETAVAKKAGLEFSESSFVNGEQINLDMPPEAMGAWKHERQLMKKRTEDPDFVIGEHVNLDMSPEEMAEQKKKKLALDEVSVNSEMYA